MAKALIYSLIAAGAVGGGIGGTILVSKYTSAYWEFEKLLRDPEGEIKEPTTPEWICGLSKKPIPPEVKPQEKAWICVLLMSLNSSESSGKVVLAPKGSQAEKSKPPAEVKKVVYLLNRESKDKRQFWKVFDQPETFGALKITKESNLKPKVTVCQIDCSDLVSCGSGSCKGVVKELEEVKESDPKNKDILWKLSYLAGLSKSQSETKVPSPLPSEKQ